MADIAHAHGVPLIVDNTFATPINCRPFEWGADIVTHSTTKYMDGHAAAVGGVIVDSGNFDWEAHKDKFPGLTEPDPSYHGLSYSKSFGKGAYITKATVQLMRDLGSIQSPQNAFLLNLGLETLHLRVPRHCENAQKVAEFLQGQEDVAWINYPGLSSNEYYELAQKQFRGGQSCGVVTFGIKGGRERYIRKMADIAHAHGVPLIVDNTFATPINCRPFEWGADIVTHSTTKYMDGHAAAVGGVIVDSGNFDWEAHKDKFPGLTEPDPSYHGLSYSKSFGKGAYITKATVQLMRDLGSIQSPQNAFLLNLGLETLHLRVPRHCENAQKVAEFLQGQEDVAWINYPGLSSNEYYELAQKQFRGGQSCGVVTFGIKGGRERSIKFMDSLKLAAIVTHVADSRTCVLHPASHTHRQLTDEQLMEAGVRPDLIRFSVGTEAAEDIIADLKQALEAIR